MGDVNFNFFGVPIVIIVSFFLFEIILFGPILNFNSTILIFISLILFIAGFVFMKLAGKTNSRGKEAYLSVLSGLFIYFSLFETPIFIKAITFKTSGFVFIILFLFFIVTEGGSFKNILINTFIFLLLIAKMLFSIEGSFMYLSIVSVSALIITAYIYYKFGGERMFFEKELFAQVIFSVSTIIAIWGLWRLIV